MSLAIWPCRCAWLWLLWLLPLSAAAVEPELTAAVALYEDRRYTDARVALRQIERADGTGPTLDFYLGRIALWFDDEREALERLQRAVEAAPDVARYHNALGDAYGLAAQRAPLVAKFGWGRKCLAAYQRAVAMEPRNAIFHWSLLAYYLHAPRVAGGGVAKAEATAGLIKPLDPEGGYAALITVHLATEDFAAAFAEADQALARDPDGFLALYQLGRCAALSGRETARGIAALRRCLTLPPPRGDGRPNLALVHHRLALLLTHEGLHEAAALHRAQVVVAQPDFRLEKMSLKN